MGALDAFLGHFSRALRDLDRIGRGAPTGRPGSPEAEASAATALRVVSITPGSAVIELKPLRSGAEDQLKLDDTPRSRLVLDRLMDGIETGAGLPQEVVAALSKARRACGDDGAFVMAARSRRDVRIDETAIERLAGDAPAPKTVNEVVGRLRQVGADPDQAVIDAPDGTEWRATFPRELEEQMRPLWLQPVRAAGEGSVTSRNRGAFTITSIAPAAEPVQTAFFSTEHRPLADVLAEQGITGPQGLATLVNDTPISDADEDSYLAAIFDGER